MFGELVKRLRNCATEAAPCKTCDMTEDGGCSDTLMKQAADAIEELSKDCDNWKATAKEEREMYWHWFDNYQRDIPTWTPVTERLPKEETEIYWCYTNMGIMCECRWTNNRWGLGESDKWGWNIMDVPQYQRVTHWMPLPQPPKEET